MLLKRWIQTRRRVVFDPTTFLCKNCLFWCLDPMPVVTFWFGIINCLRATLLHSQHCMQAGNHRLILGTTELSCQPVSLPLDGTGDSCLKFILYCIHAWKFLNIARSVSLSFRLVVCFVSVISAAFKFAIGISQRKICLFVQCRYPECLGITSFSVGIYLVAYLYSTIAITLMTKPLYSWNFWVMLDTCIAYI